MDNLSPKRITKTHASVHLKRLNSIGFGPSRVMWNDGGADAIKAQEAKTEFQNSLPEDLRGNEALAGFGNAGEMATALLKSNETATGYKTQLETKPPVTWKGNLDKDLLNSPLVQKFKDDPTGLNNAIKSHAELEKLMGHDKVPIPKGPEDTLAWNVFSKALGIPDKAEGYGLADANIPENLKDVKGMGFDKNKFAEIMHAHKATPAQAKGLWEAFQQQNIELYNKAVETQRADMDKVVNTLKGEWGDAYDTNVDLGQMVINKFAGSKEAADELSAIFLTNPNAIRLLAKVGNQFSENRIGEFSFKKFSLSAEQAKAEIDSVLKDPKHPYNDQKASPAEHSAAVDYVNSLYAVINKAKG